jgi:hypothetical protein
MQENQENIGDIGDKKGDLYVYRLRKGQIACSMAIGYDDLLILQMYKNIFKKPMVAVLHDMIGTAAMCWEEQHGRKIKEMEEKLITNELIIIRYIQKFGRISPH